MTILDQLAEKAGERMRSAREQVGFPEMTERARACRRPSHAFSGALSSPGLSFICEVKRASPSKGLIDPVFDYMQIARDYEEAGADCVSCLTEPYWFLGSDDIFRQIRGAISRPMIRKDFVVDPYQVAEARAMGADCVLLIVSILGERLLEECLALSEAFQMDALVETHDAQEIDTAVRAGAKLIGVNNRNLKDFSVDFENAQRLRDRIPPECLYVAESGVSSPEDVSRLARIGADAVLMGEVLMRTQDRIAMLRSMREAAR